MRHDVKEQKEQPDNKLKPIRFLSRFLSETEKKYAIKCFELSDWFWESNNFVNTFTENRSNCSPTTKH